MKRVTDMRELKLLETGYLAALLLLSLVLPLLMSFRGPQDMPSKRSCMRTVWVGQVLGAFAALVVLASAPFAPYAAAFGVDSCIWCALVLLRQFPSGAHSLRDVPPTANPAIASRLQSSALAGRGRWVVRPLHTP